MQTITPSAAAPAKRWDTRRSEKQRRLAAVAHLCDGPVLRSDRIV
jgi:malonate decarboxylase alpha subunit